MVARTPLNATLVFCVAARRGSFKLAAEELCVTPGAVSRQIQALESHVGQPLFERGFRHVRLTIVGEKLLARVADKLDAVATEVELLRKGGRRVTVRIDAGVTLAMHWLIPRLASFRATKPGIDVHLSTSIGPVILSKRMHLHIRRDPADLGGLPSALLLEEYSILVASPALKMAGRTALRFPTALKRCERIAAASRPLLWRQWAANRGLNESDYKPTLLFDSTALAIQAAVEGLGAIVVPEIFVASMLANGALVRLSSDRVHTGEYRVLEGTRSDSPGARQVTEWLLRSRHDPLGQPARQSA